MAFLSLIRFNLFGAARDQNHQDIPEGSIIYITYTGIPAIVHTIQVKSYFTDMGSRWRVFLSEVC